MASLLHKCSQIPTTPMWIARGKYRTNCELVPSILSTSISTVPRTQSAPLTNTLAFIFTQIYSSSHIHRHPYSTTPHSLRVSLTHTDTHMHTHTQTQVRTHIDVGTHTHTPCCPEQTELKNSFSYSLPLLTVGFPFLNHTVRVWQEGREKGRKEILVFVLA